MEDSAAPVKKLKILLEKPLLICALICECTASIDKQYRGGCGAENREPVPVPRRQPAKSGNVDIQHQGQMGPASGTAEIEFSLAALALRLSGFIEPSYRGTNQIL